MIQPSQKMQGPEKRIANFKEVCQGFSKRQALDEARRCPQCRQPLCRRACPLNIDIPGFIRSLREGDISAALKKIQEHNALPDICGRICLAPCEDVCILKKDGDPIAIRGLERYAADHGRQAFAFGNRVKACSGPKVAVIGSGPAGLTAAMALAKKNFRVTVFETFAFLGGILTYGIPALRLPNEVIKRRADEAQGLGIHFSTHTRFGYGLTLEDLREQGFAAVLLAVGSGGSDLAAFPGQFWGGVYFAEEFLMKVNVADGPHKNQTLDFYRGQKTVVWGDDYPALDSARLSRRFGKAVTLVCPSSEQELRVHPQDLLQAKEEGVDFLALGRVLEILPNESHFVRGVTCDRLDYADPDNCGQWQLIPVPGSKFILEADTVILSRPRKPNQDIFRLVPGLQPAPGGQLEVGQETMMTDIPGVFAAGEVTDGGFQLVDSVASGQRAAEKIRIFLSGSEVAS